MNWSLGLEPWSGVLEWILGAEPWSEMLERKRNIYSGGKTGLYSETFNKCITRISNGN